MDGSRSESLSDCSDISRNSEHSSDLSVYQAEFLELKHLANPHFQLAPRGDNKNSVPFYEKRIVDLNAKLGDCLQQNEKYKNANNNEKLEHLLKQNKELQKNLVSAHEQIKRLINVCSRDDDTETSQLKNKIAQLEETNSLLTNQNYLLLSKINHTNFEKNEVESKASRLKTEVDDLQIQIKSSKRGNEELKEKIVEQHLKVQKLNEENGKLTSSLEVLSQEINCSKKTEQWYKEEIKKLQAEKSQLLKINLANQQSITLKEEQIEKIKFELNSLNYSHNQMRLSLLKEKQFFMKEIQSMDNASKEESKETRIANIENKSDAKFHMSLIDDLNNHVSKLNKDLKALLKVNADFSAKAATSEVLLNDKENIIKEHENKIALLKHELDTTYRHQFALNQELSDLKETCIKLRTDLASRNLENGTYEKAIKDVKERFKIFADKYSELNNEISAKNKEILGLQQKNLMLNTKSCNKFRELENTVLDKNVCIEKLNRKVSVLEVSLKDLECERSALLQTIENLEKQQLQSERPIINKSAGEENLLENGNPLMASQGNSAGGSVGSFSQNMEISTPEASKGMYKSSESDGNHLEIATCSSKSDEVDNPVLAQILAFDVEKAQKSLNKSSKENVSICIINNIANLSRSCKALENKTRENTRLLNLLMSEMKNGQTQDLQIQLQLQKRQERERQKRYEKNNRTLLRKVKEHMKGRLTAEKQNLNLKELYNNLSQENSRLQTQISLKNSELGELKSGILMLIKHVSLTETEQKSGPEIYKQYLITIEKLLKNYENKVLLYKEDVRIKEQLLENTQKENNQLVEIIKSKNSECAEHINKIECVTIQKEKIVEQTQEIIKDLENQKEFKSKYKQESEDLKRNLQNVIKEETELRNKFNLEQEKNVLLLKEVENLKLSLQCKSEEIDEFQKKRKEGFNQFSNKEHNMQLLIFNMKKQIFALTQKIEVLENDKNFLRRLCNDLKVSLKLYNNNSNTNADKKLRELSELFGKFSVPLKFNKNNVYLNHLIEKNSQICSKDYYNDLQICIHELGAKIVNLQNDISGKIS